MFFLQMGWGNSTQEQLGPRHEPRNTRYHTRWWFQPSWKICCSNSVISCSVPKQEVKVKNWEKTKRFEITSYSHHVYIHTYVWLVWLQFSRSQNCQPKKRKEFRPPTLSFHRLFPNLISSWLHDARLSCQCHQRHWPQYYPWPCSTSSPPPAKIHGYHDGSMGRFTVYLPIHVHEWLMFPWCSKCQMCQGSKKT